MLALPAYLHFPLDIVIQFSIPKAHIPNHDHSCQPQHSLNFLHGSARTDAESTERGWPIANRIASSTKEMGPGAYRDTLNDHLGHQNHRKNVSLGK